jgi:phage gp46-like protein
MSGQDIGFFDVREPGEIIKQPDIVIENGDLKADNGLETAVLISLFSDRRADIEELPKGDTNLKGWWADLISDKITDLIGSKLWLADRAKMETELLPLLEDYVRDALNWMIEDGIAQSVEVIATQNDSQSATLSVTINKPDGDNIPFKFIWDGQDLKRSEE